MSGFGCFLLFLLVSFGLFVSFFSMDEDNESLSDDFDHDELD